jgi:putative transcriptional regulator
MKKDLDQILNIKQAGKLPTSGRVLISNPFLSDYFFRRAVVLLIEHGTDGSFGVIVNKPLEVQLRQITQSFPESDTTINLGGPVKTDGLFYLHSLGASLPGSIEVLKGVYWGGDLETLNYLLKSNADLINSQVRFYLGYAGWERNQLNEELLNRSWVVADAHRHEVFGEVKTTLWQEKVQALGSSFAPWLNFPPDPSFN